MRQNGLSTESKTFREILMRLRNGESTENDWRTLLKRTPTAANNANEFIDATRLFYKKEDVAQYNHECITQLGTPIARINAIHSCLTAASTKSDNAGGLEPVAKDAQVMLTSNLWQQVGLCNGARGTIDSLLYAQGHKPPNLPIAIMVKFTHYTGIPFIQSKPKCIPIPPIVYEWHNGLKTLSRQQLYHLD